MTEVLLYNSLDLAVLLFELLIIVIVFAIIKGYVDNKRWEKHIFEVLEQYRAKYGIDEACEMLMYDEGTKDD